jgi:hypothetical protein
VYGVDVADVVITERPLGVRCVQNAAGGYTGQLDHPELLLEACARLIKNGANAIAVTSNVQNLPPEHYAQHFLGEHPNPVGGAEAVISHLISNFFHIPAAHAPMINFKQLYLEHPIVDPRGAGEIVSVSGLACVLIGLQRAPQLVPRPGCRIADMIGLQQVIAVVAPATCLGGIPVLYARRLRIPVIAVRDNHTILDVSQERLNLNGVVEVQSYPEAAGVVLALREGISLESIFRPLAALRY